MSDILPCPFCNSTAEYRIDDYYQDKHVIHCENCGVEIRNEYSKEAAILLWNTRFAPPDHAIVPLEPTDEMIYAGCFQTPYWELVSIYKTMVKIAQEDENA